MSTVPNAANPRQRMIAEMQLRRFSERRIESYLRAVSQLAGFCWKSPDLVRDEALRDYFLYLRNPKRLARAPTTIARCGIKFFFTAVLKRDWTTMAIPRPRAALALARPAFCWQQGRPLPPPEPEPTPRPMTCPGCETPMVCVQVLVPERGTTRAPTGFGGGAG